MMAQVLLLVEHDNASVKDATLAAVTAAAELGEVTALVAGSGCDGAAQAAAQIAGVAKVLKADDAAYAHGLAENVAPLAAALMAGYDAFVAPATSSAKNIAPRVAALLDVMQVSDIISIEGPKTFTRPTYAGNAIATVESSDAKLVITVRGTAFAKASPTGGSAPIEATSGAGDAGLSSFVGAELAKSERPELTSAKIIVSGGRALKDAATFESVIYPLADKLGAAVGASRAACDAGYAPPELQVGQTGRVVAPQLYFAIGISGAIQHLAGMKGSKTIVAINKDKEAPIFQVADYGVVAEWEKAVPELIAEIKKLKASR
jgi:electron transfer flavoprotein alpha subunit